MDEILDKMIIKEIREFRNKRIKEINDGKTPKPLDDGANSSKIILHLIPKNTFAPSNINDLSGFYNKWNDLKSPFSSAVNRGYNGDGFYSFGMSITHGRLTESVGSYLHFFHNGIIEIVDLHFLCEGYFPGGHFKEQLVNALPGLLSCQHIIEVGPPVFLMLTLLNVKDFQLLTGQDNDIGGCRIDVNTDLKMYQLSENKNVPPNPKKIFKLGGPGGVPPAFSQR